MAVDTRDKRASMLNLAVPGGGIIPPVGSGSITTDDRIHYMGVYNGVSIAEPVVNLHTDVRELADLLILHMFGGL